MTFCFASERQDAESKKWIKKEGKMEQKIEPKKHKHYDLIVKWANDPSKQVWGWNEGQYYAISEKPASPPAKMIKYPLGTIEFPEPVKTPVTGCLYYYIDIRGLDASKLDVSSVRYYDNGSYKQLFDDGICHRTREEAVLRAKAFEEFIKNHQPK